MAATERTDRVQHRVHTVLIADDDEQIRSLVWEILSLEGMRVLPARNGHEALDVLGRLGEGVDLLLADVVMPRLGGRELAQRAMKAVPHIKILFVSGYGDNADFKTDFPEAEVLEKPFSTQQLTERVKAALRKRG